MNKNKLHKISTLVDELPPSGIRAFFDLVLGMDDVISLGVGEPDFVTPWHIREAAVYALEKGYTSYTSNRGMKSLLEQIAIFTKKERKIGYNPENEILVTVGVSEAMDLVMRAILDSGDEVIIPEPCYVSYTPTVKLAGGIPVILPTWELPGFKVTAEAIEKLITSKTRAIVLNYPSNPTGASYTKKELESIAEVIKRNDVLLISDEIYDHLSYDIPHIAMPAMSEMKDRTVYLNGFSKGHAMTGFRIGYACGPERIISAMTKIHQYTMLCAPIVSQMAAIEALKNGMPEVKKMAREYNHRRRLLVAGLNDCGLKCHLPEGAFYAFASVESTGMTGMEFATKLLKQEKVAVVPGEAFGSGGGKFIRLAYAASLSDIEEAVRRIKSFVKK
ncbi:MAG: pyridoxal phosphate-dependent aminotransferase [Chlamydiae bacterium]|nr:MAG: pyridoxal phosphate-dependent aminotransferase [Chlamydiota bacterium]